MQRRPALPKRLTCVPRSRERRSHSPQVRGVAPHRGETPRTGCTGDGGVVVHALVKIERERAPVRSCAILGFGERLLVLPDPFRPTLVGGHPVQAFTEHVSGIPVLTDPGLH